MQGSANLNLMIKAARRAGRSLVKDFREVENLQVSMKGAGDFVSRADVVSPAATVAVMVPVSRAIPGKSSTPVVGNSMKSSQAVFWPSW